MGEEGLMIANNFIVNFCKTIRLTWNARYSELAMLCVCCGFCRPSLLTNLSHVVWEPGQVEQPFFRAQTLVARQS